MNKYKVVTSVSGKDFDKSIETFKEQVDLIADFEDPDVFVDADEKLIIEASLEAYTDEEASKLATEHIWELVSAVYTNPDGLDVEIESVEPV